MWRKSSMRLNINGIGLIKKGEETIGSQVLVKVVKNKHAPPFQTAEFELEFGKGISREFEIIELCVKHKLISKGGGGFYTVEGQMVRGKETLKTYLIENMSVREQLVLKLREKLLSAHNIQEKDSDVEVVDTDEPAEQIVSADSAVEDEAAAI